MKTDNNLPKRPDKFEIVYAEHDEEFGWCVFGEDSGFCYCSPSTEEQAEEYAKNHNSNRSAI